MKICVKIVGNKICREFDEEVDIFDCVRKRTGIFMLHIYNHQIHHLSMDLFNKGVLDAFNVSMKPCTSFRRCVIMSPKPTIKIDNDLIVDLLDYLHDKKIAIKWKEGVHGYEITRNGTIIRKWELEPAKIDLGTGV